MKKVIYQTVIHHPNNNGYEEGWPRNLGYDTLVRIQVTEERNCFLIWDSSKSSEELDSVVRVVIWDPNKTIEWAVDYARQRKEELLAKWDQERVKEEALIEAEEKAAAGQAA